MLLSKLAIVTASDSRFLPVACCQLLSVAKNLPNREAAQLFLVTFDVATVEIKRAEEFFRRRGLNVCILAPDLDKIVAHPCSEQYPPAVYIRLYFDQIFDSSWGRIIYFDADTRVCAPLGPLLNVDLVGMPLGAVHDYHIYVRRQINKKRRLLGLRCNAPYFNSGVCVFDWHLTLRNKKLAHARRFLADHPERCRSHDQDALNYVFQGAWTPLDPRWNLNDIYFNYGGQLNPFLIHFTGPNKPWSRSRLPAWRESTRWYQQILRTSPWPHFLESQSYREAIRVRTALAGCRVNDIRKQLRPIIRSAILNYAPVVLDWLRKERTQVKLRPTPRNSDVERMVQDLIIEAEERCIRLRPPEIILDN